MPPTRDLPALPLPALRSRRVPQPSVLATLLLLFASGCAEQAGPIVFGLAGPFEERWGETIRKGAELAREEINAAGGINGRRLEFEVREEGGDAQRAIRAAEELYDDPRVVAVVGHATSGAMSAAGPVYDRGLPAVPTSATSPAISRLGRWVFRVASSDSANAVALARHASLTSPEKTAILYENDDYGRGFANSFRSAMAPSGGGVLEADPYLPETEDFSPYLERLRRKGVEMIFIAGLDGGAQRIITQAREMGMGVRFIGGDGIEGLAAMGEVYDGTLVGLLFHAEASAAARDFAERYRRAYGKEPDSFAALAYDATRLLAEAAARGAKRDAIRNYLDTVGRSGGAPAFEGAAGIISFDENGDPTDKRFAVGAVSEGRIELVQEAR